MKVKNEFFERGSFNLGNGEQIRFWDDVWLGQITLRNEFPSLYAIASNKNLTVAEVFSTVPLNLPFRRTLLGHNRSQWLNLVERLMRVTILDEPDKFRWNLNSNGVFTVKSFYEDLLNGHTRYLRKYLWKLKIPLKIKIFLWFLNRKELLTKDNLAKRRWTGCKKCVYCEEDETADHLFIKCTFARDIWRLVHFTFNVYPPTSISNMFGTWLNGIDKVTKARIGNGVAAILWAIWNCRNDIIFNKKPSIHYWQVIHKALYWINSWSFLLSVEQRGLMDAGCTRMLTVVRAIFSRHGWLHSRRLDA